MKEEKEIKIELLDKNLSVEDIKKTFNELYSIDFKENNKVLDTYFDIDNKLFNLNHALRIRNLTDKSLLTYKALFHIPERQNNPWFILEKEFEFPIKKDQFLEIINLLDLSVQEEVPNLIDEKKAREFFLNLGLKDSIIIDKERLSSDKNKGFKVLIDSVKDLGIFVEIESFGKEMQEILEKFSLPYKRILYGYTNLYAENVLGLEIPNFNKKYAEDPDWNYLKGQKEIIQNLL